MALSFKKGGRSILSVLLLIIFLVPLSVPFWANQTAFADIKQDIEKKKQECEGLKRTVNTSSAHNGTASYNSSEYNKCIDELHDLERRLYNSNVTPGAGSAINQIETSDKIDEKNKIFKRCEELNIQCNGSENVEDLKAKVEKKEQEEAAAKNKDDNDIKCAVEHLGWLICTTVNLLSSTMATGYGLLEQNFLVIKSNQLFSQQTAESKAVYESWTRFRDIGNVIFAIIFMIVVFSQISGLGISAYGIKKILPRMIIYAILMNISWYICVIAVDLSNILGVQMKEFLTSAKVSSDNLSTIPQKTALILKGQDVVAGLGLAAAGAAVGTGVISFTASGIALFLVGAFIGLMTMVIILTMRQALIIIAVVTAPIAIAMGILPGTEDWFKKWQKTFKTLLMIYPIASVIVGAALLSSSILQGAAGDNIFLQVIYALLPIFGFVATWQMIKKSLNAIGSIGEKISNFGKTAQSKTTDFAKNTGAADWIDNKSSSALRRISPRLTKPLAAAAFREVQRQKAASRVGLFDQDSRKLAAKSILGNYAGHNLSDLTSAEISQMAFAQSEVDKDSGEVVEKIKALIRQRGGNNKGNLSELLEQAILTGADKNQIKAITELAETQGLGGETDILFKAIQSVSNSKPEALQTSEMQQFFANLGVSRGKDLRSKDAVVAQTIQEIANGNFNSTTIDRVAANETTFTNLNVKEFASQNARSKTFLANNVSNYSISGKNNISQKLAESSTNQNLTPIGGSYEIERINDDIRRRV